jgi:hypothetical protein
MPITNGYATLDEFKTLTDVETATRDADIERAIESASRTIELFTGRRFWQEDGTAKTYTAKDYRYLMIDDLRNTDGLVVESDSTGDGSYETTWTISADFVMGPSNPSPGFPYEEIHIREALFLSFPQIRDGVRVTGNYGWEAIPTEVNEATLLQANLYLHRRNSPEGVAGFNEFGVSRISKVMDPTVQVILEPLRKLTPLGV